MRAKLKNKIDGLAVRKTNLLSFLETISPTLLNVKPSRTAWSVLEIVSHLMKAEEGTIQYLRKKITHTVAYKKAGAVSALRSALLSLSQRLPVKYSTSAYLSEFPQTLDYHILKFQWEKNRFEFNLFLTQLSDKQLRAGIYKNYAVGYITIYQQLNFLQIHFDRHVRQIKRTIRTIARNESSKRL